MISFLLGFLSWFGAFFRSRHDLGRELVVLQQQVGVPKRKNPRPRLPFAIVSSGWASGVAGRMGERAADREAEDRRGLASRRVPWVVALPFTPPSRPTQDHY
jgi:hypothetical protein